MAILVMHRWSLLAKMPFIVSSLVPYKKCCFDSTICMKNHGRNLVSWRAFLMILSTCLICPKVAIVLFVAEELGGLLTSEKLCSE